MREKRDRVPVTTRVFSASVRASDAASAPGSADAPSGDADPGSADPDCDQHAAADGNADHYGDQQQKLDATKAEEEEEEESKPDDE